VDAEIIRELCDHLDDRRRRLIKLRGRNPDDTQRYQLYPPVEPAEIDAAEERCGLPYPPSYRRFLELHNGWLGFWSDWSLVGIRRADNEAMYEDIRHTLQLLPTVADRETRSELPEREKADPSVMLVTNHLILGTDFNGSMLVFDGNRIDAQGEPEIAWVQYVMHVTRRWPNFEALLRDAIDDTEADIAELSGKGK
jgi:cell wall assembly regulator SMI1